MIDHIEALRDAANANDTRIRLVPDALGTIDIAVRTVGDALHVRFTAEDATTRTLIEDAQPRLAAIAGERGLRIGQSIVEAGIAAPGQPQSAQNQGQSSASQSQSQSQPGQQAPAQGAAGGHQSQTAAQAQAGQQQPRQQPQQPQTARRPGAPARTPSTDSDAGGNGRIA
ncbi:flagellar hook-length control protein FliK [Sphingomonas sp. A2-49]|nr:flagellar hook-length control protein FliK [Sphingomonas sp. A2-49]